MGEVLSTAYENTVPQWGKLDENQCRNNAGGFVWTVDDKVRLQRFLCLGSEGGSYYAKEVELTRENAGCIDRLIAEGRGKEAIEIIRQYSVEGRCAKQNSTIFALSLCARSEDLETKKAAYRVLSEVCRIPTHLFEFIAFCEAQSRGTGWGRAHRNAISKWYNNYENDPMKLALHVTKYKNRHGWSHIDVLRLCHIKPINDVVGFILRYITKGLEEANKMYLKPDDSEESAQVLKLSDYLTAIESASKCTDDKKMIELIRSYRLVREHIPTNLLNSVKIWGTLLEEMPMMAMIRNLGKMSSIGLLAEGSHYESIVVNKLLNQKLVIQSKLHPFSVLLALDQYGKSRGHRGKLTWNVNQHILSALDKTFYISFKNIEATGKRFCLAVDVSGSMGSPIMGTTLSCRRAAAAMMMTTAHTESDFKVVAFCHNLKELNISASDTLNNVDSKIANLNFGATDCALPMIWAKKKREKFDVFVVYTDCETYFGTTHPSQALVQYRNAMSIPDAKLIVVGMVSNGFSIADPADPYMLDVVGFDSAAPEVMRQFVMGGI